MWKSQGSGIIAVTESWLCERCETPKELVVGYRQYRSDKPGNGRGGGVLLLVKDSFTQYELKSVSTSSYQIASCVIELASHKISVVTIYRSPESCTQDDIQLLSTLGHILKSSPGILITGDFNAPKICWKTDYAPPKSFGSDLIQFLREMTLKQHIRDPTRVREGQNPSVLDLVITKFQHDVNNIETSAPIAKSDHLVVTFHWSTQQPIIPSKPFRNYWKLDRKKLVNEARSLKWLPKAEDESVDNQWHLIRENILMLRNKFVPLRARKLKTTPPWWRNCITKALKLKNVAWTNYRKRGGHKLHKSYMEARRKVDKMRITCRNNYEQSLAKSAKKNPKRYYRYVQSKSALRGSVGSLKNNDVVLTDSKEKANLLLDYFEKVHRSDNLTQVDSSPLNIDVVPKMEEILVREPQVLELLESVNVNKSIGVDGIHPLLIRVLANVIAPAVTNLFRLSLLERKLPGDWMGASVTPIHKGGKKEDVGNYRPVSQTAILLKVMEKLLRGFMVSHLTTHNLLSSNQHGFMRKRSCMSNLIAFLDEVTARVDRGEDVEVCYMDFRKAFDSVNHRLLLTKLQGFGLADNLLAWLRSFLIGRTFHVTVNGENSREGVILSGVPQGSVLGPLLFLLFVNDLADKLICPAFLFADDLKIVGDPKTSIPQRDLATILEWTTTWDLPLNVTKCKRLTALKDNIQNRHLGINDQDALERVDQMRDLGVQVTSDFKPRTQCLAAAKKANKALHQLRRTVISRDPKILVPLYMAFVRPHLEYCVQAWAPYTVQDRNILEDPQRRFTRWFKRIRGYKYEDRLKELGLFSMTRRRLRGDLIETFKIMKGFTDIEKDKFFKISDSRNLRGHSLKLAKKHSNLDIRLNFFTVRIINNWNRLPQRVIDAGSVEHFKQLLDNCWYEVFPNCL